MTVKKHKAMGHNILGYNPFTVEFVNRSTGATVVETYAVVLTKKEIEAEYDYISFPPNKLQLVDLRKN